MIILKSIQLIETIDYLIRSKQTGDAEQLGSRLGVSRRTACAYLKDLREMGVIIQWSKRDHSYVYNHSGKINISFKEINN